jgi:glucose-6-phosphate isomerase
MDILFDFRASGISKSQASRELARLDSETKRIQESLSCSYGDPYDSVKLPQDIGLCERAVSLVNEKKALKPEILVVVGIGGSNLGTLAIQEAVLGRKYNDKNPPMKVYFVDTVDADEMGDIYMLCEETLIKGGRILLNVVTKSGRTTETIALFELFAELIKNHEKDYKDCIIATTDRDSPLWAFSESEGYSLLEIPEKVGGRYSAFSPVGLFPLGMLGIDIHALRKGAASMLKTCALSKKNPAALAAAILYLQNKEGKNIHDNFIFSNDMESFGKWYRQLMGESIGKEFNRTGDRRLQTGMTPTVSIGSTDLHSMAQLYLGGPQDKFTTFITLMRNEHRIRLPKLKGYDSLVENIQGKSLGSIMGAIYEGVKIAYKKSKRPYMEIVLPDKRERAIAQLMQFEMLSMIYLAYLMDVNPFDQPAVERYKKETRKILSKA